jgi:mono/diheme cytochrome c family protein
MKYIILFSLSISYLFAESRFISPLEYASQLYKNPRGIGCQHCHGDNGEGKVVANYIHKGKGKEFGGAMINELSFDVLYKALNKSNRGMPRYYLTDKEIEALYLFLSQESQNVTQ